MLGSAIHRNEVREEIKYIQDIHIFGVKRYQQAYARLTRKPDDSKRRALFQKRELELIAIIKNNLYCDWIKKVDADKRSFSSEESKKREVELYVQIKLTRYLNSLKSEESKKKATELYAQRKLIKHLKRAEQKKGKK